MQSLGGKKGLEISGPFLFTPTPTYFNNRNQRLVWGLIIYFILFTFISPANCDEAADLNQQGLRYMESGDYENAIRAFERACHLGPDNEIIKKNLAIAYNNYALLFFEKGRYDLALTNFKEALKLDPENITIKDNIYNTTIKEAETSFKKGRTQEALNLAKDCIDYNSAKPSAYVLLGNIYYIQNELGESVGCWNKALSIDPQIAGLGDMVSKAKRELEVERDFKTRARTYFDIRFEGERDSELVWDVIDVLEDARYKIKSDFGFFIDESITVIIYTSEQFRHATKSLDWTLGLYDGKIRLRIDDITQQGEDMARRVIYHEYAHAILQILYPNNIPIWLHEGFAQLAEPERKPKPQDKNLLANILKREQPFKINQLSSLFSSADSEKLKEAYFMSKLFLKYLIDKYDKYKFNKLFERLNSGMSLDKAMFDIYRLHIEDIENEFIKSMLT